MFVDNTLESIVVFTYYEHMKINCRSLLFNVLCAIERKCVEQFYNNQHNDFHVEANQFVENVETSNWHLFNCPFLDENLHK